MQSIVKIPANVKILTAPKIGSPFGASIIIWNPFVAIVPLSMLARRKDARRCGRAKERTAEMTMRAEHTKKTISKNFEIVFASILKFLLDIKKLL